MVYAFALSVAGCNCGAHHEAPGDDGPADDGGLDPAEGGGGSQAQDAGSVDRDGASDEHARDAGPVDAGVDAAIDVIPTLIPTSGRHAALLVGLPDDAAPQRLIAFDLESGDAHVLAENDDLSFSHATPDGSAILFGGSERSTEDNFFIARLLDDGVMTAASITGFDGDVGDRQVLSWTQDGAFVLLSRISTVNEHAIDLIDVAQGRRHWSLEGDVTSAKTARFSPYGYWFSYTITGHTASSGIARVAPVGIHQVELSQLGGEVNAWTPDGELVAYMLWDATGPRTYYRELAPSAEAREIVVGEAPDVTGIYPLAFTGNEHLLIQTLDDMGVASLRRFELATSTTTEVELPSKSYVLSTSVDLSSLLAVQSDEATGEIALWLIDPLGQQDAAKVEGLMRDPPTGLLVGDLQLGAAGPRHFFYSQEYSDLTFVARGDDGAAVSVVTEPGDQGFGCLPQGNDPARSAERFTFVAGGFGKVLVMVDLSQPLAEPVARLEAPHGGVISCPVWSAERDSFAFVELTGGETVTGAYLYTIEWPASGSPGEPQLVLESDDALTLLAYQP